MNPEELLELEKVFLLKLSVRYERMFLAEREDLFQEGALALAEVFNRYGKSLPDAELLKVAKTVANRKMYKFAKNEFKHKRLLNYSLYLSYSRMNRANRSLETHCYG